MATNQKKSTPKDEAKATLPPAAEPEKTPLESTPPAADSEQTAEPAAAPEKAAQKAPARFRVIYRFGLNLRTAPGMDSKVVKILPPGAEVTVTGEAVQDGDRQWLPVEGGWVDMAYLSQLADEE